MLDLHIYSNHKSLNPALCCHNLSSCLPFPHKKQVPVPSKKIRTRPAGPTGPGPSDKAAQGQARRKKKKKRHSFLSVFLSLMVILPSSISYAGVRSRQGVARRRAAISGHPYAPRRARGEQKLPCAWTGHVAMWVVSHRRHPRNISWTSATARGKRNRGVGNMCRRRGTKRI